jgi:vacuolar-type H+-ATPase subunit I/STV1
MRKLIIPGAGILFVLALTWAAFGQGQGPGGARFGAQMREAQMKAVAGLQDNVAKLKALLERPMAAQGRSFQDMSEDERTKMREEFTKRREEQQKLITAIEQDLARLQGARQLIVQEDEAVAPLKDILASAQNEKAKETATKVEKLIAARQKALEDKLQAMGYDSSMIERMRQGGGRRPQ